MLPGLIEAWCIWKRKLEKRAYENMRSGQVNSTGAVKTQYTYGPFGNTTSSGTSSSNAFEYAGRENDGSGLYYYRARYYNPVLARFISEDPAGMSGSGTNLYGYVGNDPGDESDPSGLWSTRAHRALIRHAFNGCNVSAQETKAIEDASEQFDSDTGLSEDWAFAHSMRAPGQSVADAVSRRNAWISEELKFAREDYGLGNTSNALTEFGQGIHTVMDQTSPAHTDANGDPITWCYPAGCLDNDNFGKHPFSEGVSDITQAIYDIEDQALRDAFFFMTGRKLSCRYTK